MENRYTFKDGNFDPSPIGIKQLEFRKFYLSACERVNKHMLDCHLDLDILADHLVLTMRRELWCQHPGPGCIEIKYPETWWQHFKLRWFPKWLLKRFPVVYEIRKVDVQVIYPTLNIAWPEKQHIVYLADMGRDWQVSSENLLGEGDATFS